MATIASRVSGMHRDSITEVRTSVPVLWNPSTPFPPSVDVPDFTRWGQSVRFLAGAEPSNQVAVTESLDGNSAYQVLIEAIEKIAAYSELPDNWDSYGGVGLTSQARKRAQEFVLCLLAEDLLDVRNEVDILPIPTGGIQFEWAGPGGEIEVEIDQHGDFHLLIEHADGSCEASSQDKPVRWPSVRDQIKQIVG